VTATVTHTPQAPQVSGSLASNASVVVGKAAPGEMIYVMNGTTPLGSAAAGADGTFEVPLTGSLSGTSVTVYGGSVGGPSVVVPVTGATVTLPVILEGITTGASTVLVKGDPGEVVQVVDSLGHVLGTGTVGSGGTVLIQLTQVIVINQTVIVIVQGAGENSAGSGSAQPAPKVDQSGVSGQGDTLTGSAAPNSTVYVVDGSGKVVGTTTSTSGGTYSFPINGEAPGTVLRVISGGQASGTVTVWRQADSGQAYLSANIYHPGQGNLDIILTPTQAGRVQVRVYTVDGRLVRDVADLALLAGVRAQVSWNGRNRNGELVAKGIYFISAHGAGIKSLRRFIVLP
jgi:flagellar hook assembly protein FlgD